MDTITLCKAYHPGEENALAYRTLPTIDYPHGCHSWNRPIPGTPMFCIWIKINCHTLLQHLNMDETHLQRLNTIVNDWLSGVGLSVEDFNVSRIDYDRNTVLPDDTREAIIEAFQQLPDRAMRLQNLHYPDSTYYISKSRHVQVYDKDKEREDKNRASKAWEMGVLRQEVQCHKSHIKHMYRYYGLLPTWDNWVSLKMERHYLDNTKPIFRRGDFYSMEEATAIIEGSTLKSCKKRRLAEDLQLVAKGGMDALKGKYSLNTYKDHLATLDALGVNPLTIPQSYGISHFPNIFCK